MPSVDERVVSMAFENAKFEAGVAQTMNSLSKLDASLAKIGNANGLQDIEKAANKVTLEQPVRALDRLKARFSRAGDGAAQGMSEIDRAGNKVQLTEPIRALNKVNTAVGDVGRGAPEAFGQIERAAGRTDLGGLNSALDSVTSKFSVLQAAASVALGNIASEAARKGAGFVKSFTLGPIQQGFDEYQTNLGSIQTIMANTEGQKVSGLDQTNKHLQELNKYADQTIYNFSQMAKNIGTFTAAGVDMDTATSSIKGIANLAALSGSNADQAGRAMYQLSQGIAAGKIGLQDWNSVVYAGMGGAKLQKALAQTAVNMGALEEGAFKIDKATGKATVNGTSFRESIMAKPGQQSWLSSEVLTGTLEQFTGDMTDAELAAQGFTAEQIKGIQATAKSAKAAATEAKTLPQVFGIAKEAIGSGWAITFQHIFGDFLQAKKLFTGMATYLQDLIGKNADARNKILKQWSKEGGRIALIEGIKNAFKALFDILKPIGQAFRDIFPRKSADDLVAMTKNFRDFTAGLRPSKEVIEGIHRTARGFFAVMHIGWEIIKGFLGVIGDLLGVLGEGSGGFLNFTGTIGDLLVALDNALTKGGILKSFFDGLSTVLKVPLQLLTGLASAIWGLFDGADSAGADKVAGGLDKVKEAAGPFEQAVNTLERGWDKLKGVFEGAKDAAGPWIDKIAEQIRNFAKSVGDAMAGGDFDKAMSILQTGFIGAIFLSIKKAITGFGGGLSGTLGNVNEGLGALTNHLKGMQRQVKAQMILTIALAVGVLAASVFLLSKVDPKALASALTAISVGFAQLVGAMILLSKGMKGAGKYAFVQMPALSLSMVGLATAMLILGGAMKVFATMSWEDLAKGMGVFAATIGLLVVASKGIGPMAPLLIALGPAMFGMALGLTVLAGAVKAFASMSWGDLARGMVGVIGSLTALALPMGLLGPMAPLLLAAAPALIGISFALSMLSGAVLAFGSMDWGTIGKGLVGIAGSLVVLGAALWLIPPHAALMAAGLVIVAVALGGIAAAMKAFGSMSIGEIAKGLVAMAGALIILAVGLTAMIAALPGAAALLVAAGALAILAPTMAFLGTLEWGTIFKGLASIALILGTLAIVGALAAPGLAALGIALLPLAGAFLLAAMGAYKLAQALQMMAGDGMKGIAVMTAAITAFVALLPKIIIDFLKGMVTVIAELAKILPQVTDSIAKIIEQIIALVIRATPPLATAIGYLVAAILQVIIRDSPKLIKAGWTLLLNLLKGIDDNLPKVLPRVTSIIAKFLSGLAARAGVLTAAGARFIIAFLNGIAQHVGDIVRSAGNLVLRFYAAAIGIIPKFAALGPRAIAGFIRGFEDGLGTLIRAGANLVIHTLDGISGKFDDIAKAATRFVVRFFDALGNRKNVRTMVNAGFRCAANVLRGITDAIRDDKAMTQVFDAAKELGKAMVAGVVEGLKGLPGKIVEKAVSPFKWGIKQVKKVTKSKSPSQVFIEIGQGLVDGTEIGLGKNGGISKKLVDGVIRPVGKMVHDAQQLLDIRQASMVFVDIGEGVNNGLGIGLRGVPGVLDKGITGPIAAMLRETKGLRAFGQFLGSEFKEGLTGGLFSTDDRTESQKQIEGAFDALKTKITEGHKALREQVKADQDKLSELLKDPKKNGAAIDRVRRELAEDQKTLALSQFRSRSLMAQLEDEKTALVTLGTEYELVSKQLEKAKEIFNEYKNQYSSLPEISGLLDDALQKMKDADDLAAMSGADRWKAEREKQKEEERKRNVDQVALYKQRLQEQIAATQKYMETLKQLRAAGLDDVTYEKLLKQGTAGQDFASQLLAKGKTGIEELNKMNAELAKSAATMADNAAKELYKAGEQAAIGLIAGLEKKQGEIKKMMEFIANTMISSLKFRLGIRSPSRVFAEMGQMTAQGMVDGIRSGTDQIKVAAAELGNTASTALSNALTDIQNGVDSDLTITPVLDLTQVEKDASQIKDLTNVTPITAAASYGQAAAISETTQANAAEVGAAAQPSIEVNLEQNNTSPKALDDVEIYRQTKNQLSQVKSALGLAASP